MFDTEDEIIENVVRPRTTQNLQSLIRPTSVFDTTDEKREKDGHKITKR